MDDGGQAEAARQQDDGAQAEQEEDPVPVVVYLQPQLQRGVGFHEEERDRRDENDQVLRDAEPRGRVGHGTDVEAGSPPIVVPFPCVVYGLALQDLQEHKGETAEAGPDDDTEAGVTEGLSLGEYMEVE